MAAIGWAIYENTDLQTPEQVYQLSTEYSHEIGYVILGIAVFVVVFLIYKAWKK